MCDTLPYAMFKQGDDPELFGPDQDSDAALCPTDHRSDRADPWTTFRRITLHLPWGGRKLRLPG